MMALAAGCAVLAGLRRALPLVLRRPRRRRLGRRRDGGRLPTRSLRQRRRAPPRLLADGLTGCGRLGSVLVVGRLYEWPCPGDLLHIDSKRFVRFSRPGHAVTGDRHVSGQEKRMRVGHEWVHSLVDDHSRYAYSELHRDDRAPTVTAFVERGLAHFAAHGIEAQDDCSPTTRSSTATTAHCASYSKAACGSATSSFAPAAHRPTGKSSASSRPSSANGASARSTAPQTTAPKPCHTGCNYYN